jgi:hypothetical protein
MVAPLVAANQPEISLSPMALPGYALRTTTRMLAALVASLIFTFTYAILAAKSRRAEMVLIPLLDVLQSVPVLGYLSFTVVFFVSLFPGRALATLFLPGSVRWRLSTNQRKRLHAIACTCGRFLTQQSVGSVQHHYWPTVHAR